jgi:hypothetical protein
MRVYLSPIRVKRRSDGNADAVSLRRLSVS